MTIPLAIAIAACSAIDKVDPNAAAPGLSKGFPYVEVFDVKRFRGDEAHCRDVALSDPGGGFSTAAIAGQGGKGGSTNFPASLPGKKLETINWYVVLFGAIGGALGEVSEEAGVTDVRKQRIFLICLRDWTGADRSAFVYEPEPTQ